MAKPIPDRPFPFEPLLAAAGIEAISELGSSWGAGGSLARSLYRLQRQGALSLDQADRWACRLGVHPVEVWGKAYWGYE